MLQGRLEQVVRDLGSWGVASMHAEVAGGSCCQLLLLLQAGLHSVNRELGEVGLRENLGGLGPLWVLSQQPAQQGPVRDAGMGSDSTDCRG